MKQRNTKALVIAVLTFVLIGASAIVALNPDLTVQAAPRPATTPVSITQPSNNNSKLVTFHNATITADTRSTCFENQGYDVLDLQTKIDQTTTNTVTIKIQQTNDGVNFIDGLTSVSANTADATALSQYALFGWKTCLYIDVSNANTLTVQAIGFFK